jgi:hypothetical protein
MKDLRSLLFETPLTKRKEENAHTIRRHSAVVLVVMCHLCQLPNHRNQSFPQGKASMGILSLQWARMTNGAMMKWSPRARVMVMRGKD